MGIARTALTSLVCCRIALCFLFDVVFVSAVNDEPIAVNASFLTLEDTDVLITLSSTDVDGSDWTPMITVLPLSGKIYQVESESVDLKGDIIENIETSVTDSSYRVIYCQIRM